MAAPAQIDEARRNARLRNQQVTPRQELDPEANQRISKTMMWCMIVVAMGIDAFEALLGLVGIGEVGVDSVISVAADTLFIMWFWLLGVTFAKKPDRLAAMGLQALVGLIPFLDLLPELTVGVILTIRSARKEDSNV
jgi:hypothetical protein